MDLQLLKQTTLELREQHAKVCEAIRNLEELIAQPPSSSQKPAEAASGERPEGEG